MKKDKNRNRIWAMLSITYDGSAGQDSLQG